MPPPPTLLTRISAVFRIVAALFGTLALVAIFSVGGGVERYVRLLNVLMDVYSGIVGFAFDRVVEWAADLLIDVFKQYVAVGEHWKHVFTFLTLYAFADSFQFFARRDAPIQDPGRTRRLPISNEFRMGLTSVLAGFFLALIAAVAVGTAPVDRTLASGLVMIAASVGAIFLYWIVIALAHARWNRWNYAQRNGLKDVVEPFGTAFRKRAAFAVRRSLVGLAIGIGVFLVARTVAPAPGLISLGALAFALGLLWIVRAITTQSEGSLQDRWRRAPSNHNYAMGRDIVLRVVLAAVVAMANAVWVAQQGPAS